MCAVLLELPRKDRGERVVVITDLNATIQIPGFRRMNCGIEDARILVDGDFAAHWICGSRDWPIVRNTLANHAIAVAIRQSEPSSRRDIPPASQTVNDVSLTQVVVGQNSIDAVRQRCRSWDQRTGVVDRAVTGTSRVSKRGLRWDQRVTGLMHVVVSRLVRETHRGRDLPKDSVVGAKYGPMRGGITTRPNDGAIGRAIRVQSAQALSAFV